MGIFMNSEGWIPAWQVPCYCLVMPKDAHAAWMKWPVAWQKWDLWKFSNTVWPGNLVLVLLCLVLRIITIDSPSIRSCILFSGYLSIYPSIHPSIYISIFRSIYLLIYPSVYIIHAICVLVHLHIGSVLSPPPSPWLRQFRFGRLRLVGRGQDVGIGWPTKLYDG